MFTVVCHPILMADAKYAAAGPFTWAHAIRTQRPSTVASACNMKAKAKKGPVFLGPVKGSHCESQCSSFVSSE